MVSFLKAKGLSDKVDDLTMIKTLVIFFDVAIDITFFFARCSYDWFFLNDSFEVAQRVSEFKVFFDNDFISVVLITVSLVWCYFDDVAVNGIGGREIVFETCINEVFVVDENVFKLFF